MSTVTNPVPTHVGGEQMAELLNDSGLIPGSPEEEAAAAALEAESDADNGLADDDEPTPEEIAAAEREAEEDGEEQEPAEQDDETGDDEAEDDSDDDGQEPGDAGRMFTVTVDGQKMQVPEKELIAGYQRQADYSRKTGALAEERRTFEAERTAVANNARETLQALHSKLQELSEPNWQELAAAGVPRDVLEQAYGQWQERAAERDAVAIEVQRQQAAEHNQRVAQSAEAMMRAVPEWQDHNTRISEMGEIAQYMRGLGATDTELASLSDARLLYMARDAMLYRKLKSESHAVQRTARKRGKVLKAGGSETTRTTTDRQNRNARQRLARTGSLSDAARLLQDMVD